MPNNYRIFLKIADLSSEGEKFTVSYFKGKTIG